MRDGRISGSLQRALGALLLLLLECVGEDLEAGVELHGDHAGGAHARRLAPQPALAAHLLHAPRRVLQVTLAQQPGPTWKWKIYTVNVKFREEIFHLYRLFCVNLSFVHEVFIHTAVSNLDFC